MQGCYRWSIYDVCAELQTQYTVLYTTHKLTCSCSSGVVLLPLTNNYRLIYARFCALNHYRLAAVC